MFTHEYMNYLQIDWQLVDCPCDICRYTDRNATEFPCRYCKYGVTIEQYSKNIEEDERCG